MAKHFDRRLTAQLKARRDQDAQYLKHGSILLPQSVARELTGDEIARRDMPSAILKRLKEKQDLCGTCGVELRSTQKAEYFGQIFCATCVDRMKNGARP